MLATFDQAVLPQLWPSWWKRVKESDRAESERGIKAIGVPKRAELRGVNTQEERAKTAARLTAASDGRALQNKQINLIRIWV